MNDLNQKQINIGDYGAFVYNYTLTYGKVIGFTPEKVKIVFNFRNTDRITRMYPHNFVIAEKSKEISDSTGIQNSSGRPPTPRTDAAIFIGNSTCIGQELVNADFARRLETELKEQVDININKLNRHGQLRS